jgi:hypothetical protein
MVWVRRFNVEKAVNIVVSMFWFRKEDKLHLVEALVFGSVAAQPLIFDVILREEGAGADGEGETELGG